MKILIIGGDGYLGWPTAMHLSKKKHQVYLIDDFSKRSIENQNSVTPLENIETMENRVKIWNSLKRGKKVKFSFGSLINHRFIYEELKKIKPDHIIHYGEQPSAPYSMAGRTEAVFTQSNNIIGSLNLLFGIKKYCPNAHLIKLGTMGVYGTPNIDIEEGFIKIKHKNRTDIMQFPMKPLSYYHCSKAADSVNLYFASRVWGLRATDLNQGVVYGIDTPETILDKSLNTSFHYDHIFGTVINRFMVQAAIEKPMLVYGKGNQTRTFLNINDTLQCVELAIKNPARKSEYKVRNQFTEVFTIKQLATLVRDSAKKLGLSTNIKYINNPRKELAKHYFNPSNKSFLKLGLRPRKLNTTFVQNNINKILTKKDNIDLQTISPKIKWSK
jgi:UDP-sulfoquinovose synthase